MKILKGISASSGLAKGMVCVYASQMESPLPHYMVAATDVPNEIDRLRSAFESAKAEMRKMIKAAELQFDKKASEIFTSHLLIISDESLFTKASAFIEKKQMNAEHAVIDTFAGYIEKYQAEQGHFLELVHDFVDTRDRILAGFNLSPGKFKCDIGEQQPVIVAARRLTPSMVLTIPKQHVLAFVTEEGGLTSHATILARSYGVPIIFGIDVEKELDCGIEAVADGSRGELIVSPDDKTREYYNQKIEDYLKKKNVCIVYEGREARTKTGLRVHLKINISTPEELSLIKEIPHDGIGLLRTEFLFMRRETPPSEEEQYLMYKRIFDEEIAGAVTVRLLDIGGDKMPGFMQMPEKINIDLELRGALAVETFPDIFISQVRALLRAAVGKKLRLLYPMVSDESDLATFRSVVASAHKALEEEKIPFEPDYEEGIMVETPAAVIRAHELMQGVDFINVGSNDLLQYTLASSRSSQLSEKRYHILHPALLKMLEHLAKESKILHKEVCLCGEIASFEEFYPLFLQMGLRSFSVAASKFNDIKCELMHLRPEKGKKLLNEYYALGSREAEDGFFQKRLEN